MRPGRQRGPSRSMQAGKWTGRARLHLGGLDPPRTQGEQGPGRGRPVRRLQAQRRGLPPAVAAVAVAMGGPGLVFPTLGRGGSLWPGKPPSTEQSEERRGRFKDTEDKAGDPSTSGVKTKHLRTLTCPRTREITLFRGQRFRRAPQGCGPGPGHRPRAKAAGLRAGPEADRPGLAAGAWGRTQRRRRPALPSARAPSTALFHAAKMTQLRGSGARPGGPRWPSRSSRRPPQPPRASRAASARPRPLAGRAPARLPAAGRGERSGSGRSPKRSMAEAGRRRRLTRSPGAAVASTPGGGGGRRRQAAAAARAPSITRRRARNATNRRAACPGRPRVLRASEARGRGARAELWGGGPDPAAAMFPAESRPSGCVPAGRRARGGRSRDWV